MWENAHKTRGTIQVQSLETAKVKGQSQPEGDSSFVTIFPRLYLGQCLTGEVWGLCLHRGCYNLFLGTAAFDGLWKPPLNLGNPGLYFCSSMNHLLLAIYSWADH